MLGAQRLAVICALALVGWCAPARAQATSQSTPDAKPVSPSPSVPPPAPSPPPPVASASPPVGSPPSLRLDVPGLPVEETPKESARSLKVFDKDKTKLSMELMAGPIWSRSVHDKHWSHDGLEILAGTGIETSAGPFFINGHTDVAFRAIDSKSYALSVFTNTGTAGLVVGPVDLHARVGLSILTLDVIHAGWSFELLSPRVGVGAGIRLGKLRVDIEGNSEYLWRWFGGSYLIRGVMIGLSIQTTPRGTAFTSPKQ